MGNQTEAESKSTRTKRVVIVGAGPAGLLAAILLSRRNQQQKNVRYQVHLMDTGTDLGQLDDLQRVRSWMLAFSGHGIQAIRSSVPGLYEDYVAPLGISTRSGRFCYGKWMKVSVDIPGLGEKTEEELRLTAMTIDRNYLCAAMSRYLREKHYSSEKKDLTIQYDTTALLVDADTKRLLVRKTIGKNELPDVGTEQWIPYDILLGCDGIRSVVRNAFVVNHREFEMDVRGTFGVGKSVHVQLPKDVPEGEFMLLAECVPNLTAFCLPNTGGMLNFACGYPLNRPCDDALLSNDAATVAAYFRQHFTAFDMDFDEMGREWVKQSWSSTQQVHCNQYHSYKLNALLMGDAAHATSPQIGEGMNTALEDVACLNELLDEYDDDWVAVLPAFSKLRVKEGNALTDLSFHTYSLSGWMQMEILLRQNVRRLLNKCFPALVEANPMDEVPMGMKLSVAYDKLTRYGYLQKSRRINQETMQAHFERSVGMVVADSDASWWKGRMLQVLMVLIAVVVALLLRNPRVRVTECSASGDPPTMLCSVSTTY